MHARFPNCDKKHPCPDCTFCQWCSDDRCRACRMTGCSKKKLSIAEQIERYERMNRENEAKVKAGEK